MLHIGQHQPLWTPRILLVYNTSAAWTSWSKDEDLSGTQPHVLHAYSQRHALSGLTWQNDAILQPTDCALQGLYHCSSICRQSDNRTEGANTYSPLIAGLHITSTRMPGINSALLISRVMHQPGTSTVLLRPSECRLHPLHLLQKYNQKFL